MDQEMCIFYKWSIFECVLFFIPQTLLIVLRQLKMAFLWKMSFKAMFDP